MVKQITHSIILALGSNTAQEYHLREAEIRLRKLIGKSIRFSKSLWTTPLGIKSDLFLNELVIADTILPLATLRLELQRIEHELDTTTEQKRQGIVGIDIDLLCYDGERWHHSDWRRPYIQQLLSTMLSE